MSDSIPEELRSLATRELQAANDALPTSAMERLTVFLEVTRVVDYETIVRPLLRKCDQLPPSVFDLAMWGWKFVASRCLSPMALRNACPLMESTPESRAFAAFLLQQFGRADLIRRVADMVEHGLMIADRTATGISLQSAPHTASQFVDTLEFSSLRRFDSWISAAQESSYNGWALREYDHVGDVAAEPGAFLGRGRRQLSQWRAADVEGLMLPLLRPWDSGRGMMIAYDAVPEVDDHFLAEAFEFMQHCRHEAGLHPGVDIEGVGGDVISAVATAVASFHLNHVRFALLAMKQKMPVSLFQSLTIWTPEDQLTEGLAE